MPEKRPIADIRGFTNLHDRTSTMEWLVEGLIPEASVVLLSGESGCGKSTVLLALADAVTNGNKFLNRTCKQRDVLIVDKENGISIYHERFKRLNIQKSENLFVWGLWESIEPEGPDSPAILKFMGDTKPLIIFDSLIAFHPKSEQDASETRQYMQLFRYLAGLGATVIVIHHTGKGENSKKYRGSSDIMASVDVAILLKAYGGLHNMVLDPFKVREGLIDPVKLSLEGGSFVAQADELEGFVKSHVTSNPGQNEVQIIAALDGKGTSYAVRSVLHRGIKNGWLLAPKGAKNANCYRMA
jgi:hypothetical protein